MFLPVLISWVFLRNVLIVHRHDTEGLIFTATLGMFYDLKWDGDWESAKGRILPRMAGSVSEDSTSSLSCDKLSFWFVPSSESYSMVFFLFFFPFVFCLFFCIKNESLKLYRCFILQRTKIMKLYMYKITFFCIKKITMREFTLFIQSLFLFCNGRFSLIRCKEELFKVY